jgi:hypothetical protein
MVDRLIFVLAVVVIPATVLATIYRLLSIEVALGVVWTTALLAIAIGVSKYWQDPEAYDRPGQITKEPTAMPG